MYAEQTGPRRKEVRLPVWMDALFQGIIDLAQSKRVCKPARILCACLISLVFLISIAGLFLLMGLAILAYYLHFLNIFMRKGGKKP